MTERPKPLSPEEERLLRKWLAHRHPAGPGLTAEAAQRLFATLDRDRGLVKRAASAMREVCETLSGDDRELTALFAAVDLDRLSAQALDTREMMDTDALARAARRDAKR